MECIIEHLETWLKLFVLIEENNMNNLAFFINGAERYRIDDLMDSLRAAATQEIKIQMFHSEQLTGAPEFTIAITASVGLGVIIKQAAQILTTWIKRSEAKSVKVGEVEIKGYSVKEVERILQAYQEKPNKAISADAKSRAAE